MKYLSINMNNNREIHNLLEKMNKTHHTDMKDIIVGRFNENKMLSNNIGIRNGKPIEKWRTSLPKRSSLSSKLKKKSSGMALPEISSNLEKMTQALFDFSMGADGCISGFNKNGNRVNKQNYLLEDDCSSMEYSKNLMHKKNAPLQPITKCPNILPTKREQYRQQVQLKNSLDVHVSLPKKQQHLEDYEEICSNVKDGNFETQSITVRKWNENYKGIQSDVSQIKMINELESRILKEISVNEHLRKELQMISTDLPPIDKEEETMQASNNALGTEESADTADEDDMEKIVYNLQSQIQEKYAELERIRKDQKDNYVPVVICERLENCIKETEVDIQKLCKQNEFLEHNLEELEEELERILVKSSIKERDARLLWKKVSFSKVQDY